jgi:hypothetical protein
VQHLGEERSGCNGEKGEGQLGFLRRGGSDAPDALDAKPMAHNQIHHPCPDLDK